MKKTRMKWILFAASLILLCATAEAKGQEVLLVYDTKQQAEELSRLIAACGKTSNAVQDKAYRIGEAAEYRFVITTTQTPLEDCMKADLIPVCVGPAFESTGTIELIPKENLKLSLNHKGYSQPSTFEKKAVLIGRYEGEAVDSIRLSTGEERPFAVFASDRVSIPYVHAGDLSAVALGAVLRQYFRAGESGKMYVLIDEIYPFSDLSMLCSAADALHENALPFILRIMPVYDHLDYPAFLRYAQVLRYVQSRGGTIVLHEPLVIEDELEREPLPEKLNRFYAALEEQDIDWMHVEYAPYPLSLEAIGKITSSAKNFGDFPMDTMIALTLPKDREALALDIEKLNSKWLSIEDYKRKFTSENYRFNEKSVDAQYDYVKEEEARLQSLFSIGNRLLLVAVSVCLLAFFALIAVGYRYYRRKFSKGNRI